MNIFYKNILLNLLLLCFLFVFSFFADAKEKTRSLQLLTVNGDTSSANINHFYNLAFENLEKNTPQSRTLAREYMRRAIRVEPGNILYRLTLASMLEEYFSASAEEEYNNVLSLDQKNITALLGLARIRERDFYEWLNSVKLFQENIVIEFNDFAMEDFSAAEDIYKKVLLIDSLNYNANMNLALLYESINKYDTGIFYLNRLEKNYQDSFQVHLSLGLITYKLSQLEKANLHFLTALDLMTIDKKNEFIFKSVAELLEPVLKEKLRTYTEYEAKELFEHYWMISDPLHLTEYNERLIEHYSRIVYADLRFSLRNRNKSGWRTDRGDIVMRYGEPYKTMRIRPNVDWGAFNVKTEVWYYENMVLGFSDTYSSGDYVFNIPSTPTDRVRTQFAGDTFSFINELKRDHHQYYLPKYEGPEFSIDLNITQFRNEKDKNKTDVYINYGLTDSLTIPGAETMNHKYGIFFFDSNFEKVFEERADVSVNNSEKYEHGRSFVNSAVMSTGSLEGKLAFEIIRERDKGVSSNHGKFKVQDFTWNKVLISNILFASQIHFEGQAGSFVKRKNLSLLANPSNRFDNNDDIYIYYEVYNLGSQNDVYEFEQIITLKNISSDEYSIGQTIGSILNFIGFNKNDESLSLSSSVKSLEQDAEVYLQLDFSGYESGEYELELKIRDKSTGEIAGTKSVFRIK